MNQSVLILADFVPSGIKYPQTIDVQDIDLEKLFKISEQEDFPKSYLYIHKDCQLVFQKIKNDSKIIKAAGGLVKNGDGDYLFIFRLGKWDLPKGKVESHEKMKEAAVREVEEECGLKINYLGKKIQTSYHTYRLRNGEFVLKQTNWYEMGVNKVPKLIPQTEEDITNAEWLGAHSLKQVRQNTYPIIENILDENI
ncbi:NUDIX domain-containing protein [Sphingobacterium sp. SRCM116780]|uniref:NUDIX domain-containing protein n=1 Tax=Sphingobacterium sp. SRCM116780 TaxID=2907623 RepID=UPI001F37289E|nr:NUDIX domain-containing protein [Sphingobacterium sp. SRCM116780]UIR57945.1 NUDIX domain-containing protein [Sphingobacterium sp. SRCM116780]